MLDDDVVAVIELAFNHASTGESMEGPVFIGPDKESALQYDRVSQTLSFLMPQDLRTLLPELLIWTMKNGEEKWLEDILWFLQTPLVQEIEQRSKNLERDKKQRDYEQKRHYDLERREESLKRDIESRNDALDCFVYYTLEQKFAVLHWLEWVSTLYGDSGFLPLVPVIAFWEELIQIQQAKTAHRRTDKKKHHAINSRR